MTAQPENATRRFGLSAAVRDSFVLSTLAFGALAGLFIWFPVLYDTDSYYHLAIARTFGSFGILDQLPWARFSVMHDGFGDKEFLFHLLTAPFTWIGAGNDSGLNVTTTGGRVALAFWNGLIVFLLGYLGHRQIGRAGLLLPAFVWLGSLEFLSRATRLRPELLSLSLLLLALIVASKARYRLLAVVGMLYALSYTAFHILLVVCAIWFVQRAWTRRRFEFELLLYPTLGCLVGLLLHPNFPHNLVIWKIQSIDYFRYKSQLDIGLEILPGRTDDLLLQNLPLLVGLGFLWMTSKVTGVAAAEDSEQERLADWSAVSAATFVVLYFLGRRFAIYAVPFLAVWVVAELGRRGRTVFHGLRLPFGEPQPNRLAKRLTIVVLFPIVALLLIVPAGLRLINMGTARGGDLEREQDWQAAGAALPLGARVAAEWGSGQLYLYFAQQATFLNVLDPVFMALPFPEEFEVQRRIFRSLEPEIPLNLVSRLDSDYIMLSEFHDPPELLERLAGDPRLKLLYRGYNRVYQVAPSATSPFLIDWRLVPPSTPLPVSPDTDLSQWPAYPARTVEAPELRLLEGYVDLERLLPTSVPKDARTGCVTMVRDLAADGAGIPSQQPSAPQQRSFELAPWFHTSVWFDHRLVLVTQTAQHAVLGRGFEIELPQSGRLTISTCFEATTGRGGFFLHELHGSTTN